jgi:hypothetical protein
VKIKICEKNSRTISKDETDCGEDKRLREAETVAIISTIGQMSTSSSDRNAPASPLPFAKKLFLFPLLSKMNAIAIPKMNGIKNVNNIGITKRNKKIRIVDRTAFSPA